MDKEYSSDDSVDRALKSDSKSRERSRSGTSTFRNKDGSPMYLQANQNGSNVSLVQKQTEPTTKTETTNIIHKKSKSEGQINPDSLPRHPEPKPSFETANSNMDKLQIPRITLPRPGTKGRRESIVNGTENFDSIELKDNEESRQNHVRRRTPKSESNTLRINTDRKDRSESNDLEDKDLFNYDNYATASAVSPEIAKPVKITKGKVHGKPALIRSKHNNRKSSSSSSDGAEKLIAKATLQNYDQGQNDIINDYPDESQRKMINDYLKLIEILRIERIFYNPELDILNRFCLEYTGLCVHTEPKGAFIFKQEHHCSRIYNYMEKRINSTSTPTNESSVGIEIPTLITRLFLGDFRITSDGSSKIDITIPILSHSHKLSLERFKAIVINIFDKKRKYYKTIDISRHEITHLA